VDIAGEFMSRILHDPPRGPSDPGGFPQRVFSMRV
jgi:hypothetical protein